MATESFNYLKIKKNYGWKKSKIKKPQSFVCYGIDLDWSNSMQRDIEFTASNGEKVRKQIGHGELTVVNIYISQFPPVDDYEYRIRKSICFSHRVKKQS